MSIQLPLLPLQAIIRLSDKVHEALDYYVYLLRDPRDNAVLYIGKGKGNRLFAHTAAALKSNLQSRKLQRIREITAAGAEVGMVFVRHGLTEKEAYEVEGALIDLYPDALNEADGHHNATRGMMTLGELVAEYEARSADINVPCVLININRQWHRGLPANQLKLYAAVRGDWVVQPKRHRAQYAFAIARGIIRQVYAIDGSKGTHGWINLSMAARPPALQKHQKGDRYVMTAKVASELAYFIGQSVIHLQKPGAQNPIRWLHC